MMGILKYILPIFLLFIIFLVPKSVSATHSPPGTNLYNFFVVEPFKSSPTNPDGTVADCCDVVIENRNIGLQTSNATIARLKIDGVSQDFPVPALDEWQGVNGHRITVNNAWNDGALGVGNHTFELCIDPNNNVAETNETDNCRTVNVTVGGADLVTEGVGFSTNGDDPDTAPGWWDYNIWATVRNTGTAASNPAYVNLVATMNISSLGAWVAIPSIPAGGSVFVSLVDAYGVNCCEYNHNLVYPVSGSRAYACGDYANTNNERLELNNCGNAAINPAPTPTPSAGSTLDCQIGGPTAVTANTLANFLNNSTGSYTSSSWTAGAGSPLSSSNNTFAWTAPGTNGSYPITLTIDDGAGGQAPDTCSFNVTVNGGTGPSPTPLPSATPPPAPPGPFTLTVTTSCVNATTARLNMSWTAASGAGFYDVDQNGSWVATNRTTTTYTRDVSSGGTYDIRIYAKQGQGSTTGTFSNTVTVNPNCTPPGTFNLTGTIDCLYHRLSWEPASGVNPTGDTTGDRYEVYFSSNGSTFQYVGMRADGGLTFTYNTSFTNNYYYVTAFNQGGSRNSAQTVQLVKPSDASCTPPQPTITPLLTPNCISAGAGGNVVRISWTNNSAPVTWVDISTVSGFTGGYYHKSVTTTPNAAAQTNAPTGFTHTSTNAPLTLNPNTDYFVRLWNERFLSTNAQFNIPACSNPPGPFDLDPPVPGPASSCVSNTTYVDLTWDPSSNVNPNGTASGDRYSIYRSTDGTNYTWIGDQTSPTSRVFRDTDTRCTTVYWYRVYAYNPNGNTPSDPEQTTTNGPPDTTNPSVSVTFQAGRCYTASGSSAWPNPIQASAADNVGVTAVNFRVTQTATSTVVRNGSTTTLASGTPQSGFWNIVIDPAAAPVFATTAPNNAYTLEVQARDAANNLSSWTVPAAFTYAVSCAIPWIQTTGGDVHTNTGINTPGGP